MRKTHDCVSVRSQSWMRKTGRFPPIQMFGGVVV